VTSAAKCKVEAPTCTEGTFFVFLSLNALLAHIGWDITCWLLLCSTIGFPEVFFYHICPIDNSSLKQISYFLNTSFLKNVSLVIFHLFLSSILVYITGLYPQKHFHIQTSEWACPKTSYPNLIKFKSVFIHSFMHSFIYWHSIKSIQGFQKPIDIEIVKLLKPILLINQAVVHRWSKIYHIFSITPG
jgi:hypothetical protein